MKTCKSLARRRLAGTAALALWLILASLAAAQPADAPNPAFARFDQELKAVIRAENVAALALLVKFPLRVNHGDGSVTSLDNPRALLAYFPKVFTPAVRRDILETKAGDHIFRSSDIGYGGGLIWIEEISTEGEDTAFRIKAVNLDDLQESDSAAKSLRLSFVCETTKHRILIEDKSSDNSARYRVWNRPKSPLEAPDLEIKDGKAGYEGSGVCAARFWEFPTGPVTIRVSELGCGPGDEPNGAVGDLVVTKKDGAEQRWYCF